MGYNFVQIPPDSTGKKINHIKRLNLIISNPLVNLIDLNRGDLVTGNTSGATAKFLGTHTEFNNVYMHLADVLGTFIVGEQLYVKNINSATIVSFETQYTPTVAITDRDYLHHTLKVSHEGSAYVRYAAGDLDFDAFGNAKFSQTTQIDKHSFLYGDEPDKYWDEEINNGLISFNTTGSEMVLSTNSSSGSRASRQSHQYYPYNPGEGNEMLFSVRIGDTGKAGVIRRWGAYDTQDGIFFQMNETDYSVVLRNSTSGTVIDTVINSADFNGDDLKNTNSSAFIVDPTKYNLYWLDYQWLGVGRVRFGVFSPDGRRIIVHVFENINQNILPWSKRGTLPFRIEQFNITNVASSSEMRMICSTVSRQASTVQYNGKKFSYTSDLTTVSGSTFIPLMSTKPLLSYNGETNRVTMMPTNFEVTVIGDPIELQVTSESSLVGSLFNKSAGATSAFIIDDAATSISGGSRKEAIFFGSGVTNRIVDEDLNYTFKMHGSGLYQPSYNLSIKTVDPNGNAKVSVLFRWKEVQ